MESNNTEAIRQRMMSILQDSEAIRHSAGRLSSRRTEARMRAQRQTLETAEHLARMTRELYHLLPDDLRPPEISPKYMPRHSTGETVGRGGRPPTPGGKIPRKVRWPDWTIDQILLLADAYHETHGQWPRRDSGRIGDASPDTWAGVDLALKRGNRGLPGGTSLALLLKKHRGVPTRSDLSTLDIETILHWADDHHARTGKWPTVTSGPILAAPGETWQAISHALNRGTRGLSLRTSLARLLAERRGVYNHLGQSPLTIEQILTWAKAWRDRTGRWPTRNSGDIPEAPGERWGRVDNCLIYGARTLPAGSSIARLLAEHLGVRNRMALPNLEIDQILEWADRHFERIGRWPTCWSGKIEDAPGETWNAVDSAFKAGRRGLTGSGYRSLAHLLDVHRADRRGRGNRSTERPSDRGEES